MRNLILLVGPPCSGKSTFSIGKIANGYTRISQDDQGKGHLEVFLEALNNEDNIVVDRMNFNRDQRRRYLEPALAQGYQIEVVVADTPQVICRDRLTSRLTKGSHPTIKTFEDFNNATNTFFRLYEKPKYEEGIHVIKFLSEFYPLVEEKKKAIICDLDGTLADIEHRRIFLDKNVNGKKNWKEFNNPDRIRYDKLQGWCADILNALQDTHEILLVSGREEASRIATVLWLISNGIEFASLDMRPTGDYRDDTLIKETILDFEILPLYDISFAIDDRKRVVDMWRSRGIVCLQCAEGNF
jgi:hypothetical protein